MSKTKLTKTDKQNINRILRNYLISSDERFDNVKRMNKFLEEEKEKFQRIYFERIKLSDEFYDYCIHRNIFDNCTICVYGEPVKDLRYDIDTDRSFDIKMFSSDEWCCHILHEEAPEAGMETDWKSYIRSLYKQDLEQMHRDYFDPITEEFEKVLENFETVVYNFKSLDDIYEFSKDSIPELAKYCLNQIKAKGSTVTCINQETINFVNNYLQANKNIDSEKE